MTDWEEDAVPQLRSASVHGAEKHVAKNRMLCFVVLKDSDSDWRGVFEKQLLGEFQTKDSLRSTTSKSVFVSRVCTTVCVVQARSHFSFSTTLPVGTSYTSPAACSHSDAQKSQKDFISPFFSPLEHSSKIVPVTTTIKQNKKKCLMVELGSES